MRVPVCSTPASITKVWAGVELDGDVTPRSKFEHVAKLYTQQQKKPEVLGCQDPHYLVLPRINSTDVCTAALPIPWKLCPVCWVLYLRQWPP